MHRLKTVVAPSPAAEQRKHVEGRINQRRLFRVKSLTEDGDDAVLRKKTKSTQRMWQASEWVPLEYSQRMETTNKLMAVIVRLSKIKKQRKTQE